jgi:hypothetical protein
MNNAWHIDGVIAGIETIAEGHGIRELKRLREQYPTGKNWSKKKGFATVNFLRSGKSFDAEIHWYEAHGIGRVETKIKTMKPKP